MSDETIADIVQEMRGARTEFPFVYLMGEPDTPAVIDAKTKKIIELRKINIRRVTVKELSDRIEAAWEREKAEVEASALAVGGMVEASRHKQVGNSAAMREALEKIAHYCDDQDEMDDPYCADGHICAHIARKVLASPPRNCDRLSSDQCKEIFKREMGIYLPQETADRDRDIIRRTAYCVINALYAEQEGEGDAK